MQNLKLNDNQSIIEIKSTLPNHIGFIMSGNRTWAKIQGLDPTEGHNIGSKNIEKIASICFELGIKNASFWAMSTENMTKRPPEEIKNLFKLVDSTAKRVEEFIKNGIRIFIFGNLEALPLIVRKTCIAVMEKTKDCKNGTIGILFNYGGRWEVIDAVQRILIDELEVTEENITKYLTTSRMPTPDLIVRCGDDSRLSGFYTWSGIYSELYFSKKMWPEFDREELIESLKFFSNAKRNFGA